MVKITQFPPMSARGEGICLKILSNARQTATPICIVSVGAT